MEVDHELKTCVCDFDAFAQFLEWVHERMLDYDWCVKFIPWLQNGKVLVDNDNDSTKLYNHWFVRYQKFVFFPATFLETVSIQQRLISLYFSMNPKSVIWNRNFNEELLSAFFALENSTGYWEFALVFPPDMAQQELMKARAFQTSGTRYFAKYWKTLDVEAKQKFYEKIILPLNVENAKCCQKKYFLPEIHGISLGLKRKVQSDNDKLFSSKIKMDF